MRSRSRCCRTRETGTRGGPAGPRRRPRGRRSPERGGGTASAHGDDGRSSQTDQAEIRFCHCVRYFWLFRALASKILTLSSIFLVGKMSGFFATVGSYFFAHAPAPTTGGM